MELTEELTEELKKLLFLRGAELVGVGDISHVPDCNFRTGVAVAVALPKNVIKDLQEAPTKEYYELYGSKTVAVKAGLGWIGKNCLLVTSKYGSAVRISSLLTNAPLVCGEPITDSRCGKCSICVESCAENVLRSVHIPGNICKAQSKEL